MDEKMGPADERAGLRHVRDGLRILEDVRRQGGLAQPTLAGLFELGGSLTALLARAFGLGVGASRLTQRRSLTNPQAEPGKYRQVPQRRFV